MRPNIYSDIPYLTYGDAFKWIGKRLVELFVCVAVFAGGVFLVLVLGG